jgi:hypothetical protein
MPRPRGPKPKPPLSWKRTPPIQKGWYWYRDANRDEVILHVFDPLGNKVWKAWDWTEGQLMLCEIAGYEGEWYGPLEVPV